MVLWISPWKLFKNEVLAGVIFILALVALLLDVTLIALRSYWYAYVTDWQLDNLLGLDGISFGILLSILWWSLQVCLLVDLLATLLIASRDLQEGTVVIYGIMSIMQIPLVLLFLMYELTPTNQLWLLVACVETKYAEDCSAWLTSHKHMMVIPSALACALHIIIVGLASYYIRHRKPTSASLLLDDELEYLKEREKSKEEKKKRKAARKEEKKKAKEEKEKNKKKRGPTYVWRSGSSSGESDVPTSEAPFCDQIDKEKGLDLIHGAVHTDSSDGEENKKNLSRSLDQDLEKQDPSVFVSPPRQTEKELGRRSRRGSMSSRRSSRGY
ncbi:uncharacterized protein JCM6883_004136 [Sporobolomyces salmoneus]|uniref:uncharacterized protein n=1 Tax=Sporobolomyces salmoneus TaxID=183962 RepID=UPI0031771398